MITYKLSDILDIVVQGFKKYFYGFNFRFETEVNRIREINGNYYLELVEFDEDGKIKAKAQGIVFDEKIYEDFLIETNINDIQDLIGYKFLFHGRVNFHKDYGFSIIINKISSEYLLGQFKKNKEKIKNNLIQKGIIDNNKQLSVGYPPLNIAIISSRNSEGLNDFVNILEESEFKFNYQYYYSSIHGNEAKKEVYNSLETIEKNIKSGQKIDLVCIIRGGGASHGIIWQDDEYIAEKICNYPSPVLTAIGHTSDTSILDEIVKYPYKTPSDAAYKIISLVNNIFEDIQNNIQEINQNYSKKIDSFKNEIYNSYKDILNLSNQKIQFFQQNTKYLYQQINQEIKYKTKFIKDDIKNTYQNIQEKYKQKISNIKNSLEVFYSNIYSFSPEKLTKSGYGIVMDLEKNYLSKEQINSLKKDDFIFLNIYDKTIKLQVKDIENIQ